MVNKRIIITLSFLLFAAVSTFAENNQLSGVSIEASDSDVMWGENQETQTAQESVKSGKKGDKSVSNVRVSMSEDNTLNIIYDLIEESDVSVFFSLDDGVSFLGPMRLVSGDVGEDIEIGSDRLISWNIVGEMGEINVSQARIKVIAKPVKQEVKWKNTFLFGVTQSFSDTDVKMSSIPYSVMYGGYKKAGFYTRFEMMFDSPSGEDVSNIGAMFYDGTGSYSWMATSFGLLFRLKNFGALGLGASGARRTLYANTLSGNSVKYAEDLLVGGEVSLIINIKFISIGVTAIYYELKAMPVGNASIGFNF